MKEQRNKPQKKNWFKWIRRSYFVCWIFMGALSLYFWLFVENPAHKLDFGTAWKEGMTTGNWIFIIFFLAYIQYFSILMAAKEAHQVMKFIWVIRPVIGISPTLSLL